MLSRWTAVAEQPKTDTDRHPTSTSEQRKCGSKQTSYSGRNCAFVSNDKPRYGHLLACGRIRLQGNYSSLGP